MKEKHIERLNWEIYGKISTLFITYCDDAKLQPLNKRGNTKISLFIDPKDLYVRIGD